jgi:hypothetical protein
MRYLLMICTDESDVATQTPDDTTVMNDAYRHFAIEMGQRGVLQGGGERLRPTTDATTVRVRDGETVTFDGPFAETKEQVAGYYVVDCKDIDEAIEVASKVPAARNGSVEVRPIWELS